MAGDNLYYMGNHVLPSTGLPTKVTTTTAATVMLQLSSPSSRQFTLVEYGISFDGAPSAIQVQLRTTSATCTTTSGGLTAGVINPFTNPSAPASLSTTGTSNSLFYNGTSTSVPTATVSAVFDTQILSTNTYTKQWPLNREPGIPVSNFLQLCVLTAAAVNASCYFIWREQ